METADQDKNKYISLVDAAKISPYSEPYLRLRARQGKLKSIKIGRKWMTTAAWLDDYSRRVQDWNDKIKAKQLQAKPISKTDKVAEYFTQRPSVLPPAPLTLQVNIPVPDSDSKKPLLASKPFKPADYFQAQILFVLGSAALIALMLFVWMGDFGVVKNISTPFNQANVSQTIKDTVKNSQPNTAAYNSNGFEQQLAPQILEENFRQRPDFTPPAAVYQTLMLVPQLTK